jgi:signal transduction histidine kinase
VAALVVSAPGWMWIGAAALIVYPIADLVLAPGTIGEPARLSIYALRLVIEGSLFLWAARRVELPQRLRLSLQVGGWTSIGAAVNYLLLVPPVLGGPQLLSAAADSVLTLAGYVLTLVALVIYPRAPARRGERLALYIDLLITAGGIGLVSWMLITAPVAAGTEAPAAYWLVIVFGVAQIAMLIGLNIVVVRGLPVPSHRAFWWFVAGQAMYLPVVVLAQFESAGYLSGLWGTAFYFWGVLPTIVGMLAMHYDPVMPAIVRAGPAWLSEFNPLPLLVPLAVGAGLLFALVVGPATAALPLAATLTAVSLLMATRLLLSARHAAQLTRAETDAERRRQRDKMQAVARLAGGVAHEFNNLMTRVIGHAELGEDTLSPGADARLEFQQIRAAAERATALTSQLLTFSGRQRAKLEQLDIAAWLRAGFPAVAAALPPGIEPQLHVRDGPTLVWADGAQLAIALGQIAANAAEAMPAGGRLQVELVRRDLAQALATPLLRVPAGRYAVLQMRDSGRGIPPDDLAAICDPFFSTKAPYLAAGLGLASVYGIVAAHGGGLAVESVVGAGTTVSIYLPTA